MRRTLLLCALAVTLVAQAEDRGLTVQAATQAGINDYDPRRMHALIIGINEYQHWSDLRSARPDAEAVAQTLIRDYGYPLANVTLILDREATRRRLFEALASYRRLTETDSLLIYYAGHGWMDEARNGFWVSSEVPRDDSTDYLSNAQIVNEYFKKYQVKHLLVIADSCFAGTMLRAGEYQRDKEWRLPAGYRKPSRWILTSGDMAPVEDDAGSGHSPFATRLLQYLRYSDQPAFGVNDLYVYVRQNLASEALAKPLDTPGHMLGGEYTFARLDRPLELPDAGIPPPVTMPRVPEPTPKTVAATGTLVLTCHVRGALFVNEQRRLTVEPYTSYTFRDLPTGPVALRIESTSGTWQQTANVLAYQTVNLEARLAGRDAPRAGQPYTVPGLKLPLVALASGRFTQGDRLGEDDERPAHQAILTQPFWMGQYEVTTGQFLAFLNDGGPSYLVDPGNPAFPLESRQGRFVAKGHWSDPQLPIVGVDYAAASAFCAWLTERELRADRLPAGYVYRLPTEAEWEYACRAGTTSDYSYGFNLAQLGQYAWSRENAQQRVRSVGGKRPNPWNLYDLHGNAWEWCLDWYGPYAEGVVTDPLGPAAGTFRILRGGSVADEAKHLRAANRGRAKVTYTHSTLGFRVVLAPRR